MVERRCTSLTNLSQLLQNGTLPRERAAVIGFLATGLLSQGSRGASHRPMLPKHTALTKNTLAIQVATPTES